MREFHSPWEDPNVKMALKQRDASDIALICCGRCHNYGYYNQGSHFTCSWCEWFVGGEELDAIIDNGEVISLSDYTDRQVSEEDYP